MFSLEVKGWMRSALAAVGAGALLAATGANAAVTFSGTSGSLAASVTFAKVAGNQLKVVLTNTSSSDTLVPADLLTAVFFNVTGNPTLSKISGVLTAGSSVFYDPDGQPLNGVIGGEWAYKRDAVAPLAYGANYGISSTGIQIFGPADVFPGANLAGPVEPNGPQYGILSAGDNTATGNPGGIKNSGGLIKNSVTFILGGFTGKLADISGITFQYGTDRVKEPHFGGGTGTTGTAPEPGMIWLMGASLVAAGGVIRRRRT